MSCLLACGLSHSRHFALDRRHFAEFSHWCCTISEPGETTLPIAGKPETELPSSLPVMAFERWQDTTEVPSSSMVTLQKHQHRQLSITLAA